MPAFVAVLVPVPSAFAFGAGFNTPYSGEAF
jgi:hypothetical protein